MQQSKNVTPSAYLIQLVLMAKFGHNFCLRHLDGDQVFVCDSQDHVLLCRRRWLPHGQDLFIIFALTEVYFGHPTACLDIVNIRLQK